MQYARRVALIVAVFLLFAATARADWQFARWGMTTAEIVAASKGTGRPSGRQEKDFTVLATGDFSTGPFSFAVEFYDHHGDGRLATVRLNLKDPSQFQALWDALNAKYGKGEILPENHGDHRLVSGQEIRWLSKSDAIALHRVDVHATDAHYVFMEYAPIQAAADL